MDQHRDYSNRLTFDFYEIEIKDYLKVTKAVKHAFSLEEASIFVHGFDETFQEFKTGAKIIGLEWDIWSGYIVVAKNEEAEPLAREIAKFIEDWVENMHAKAVSGRQNKFHSLLTNLFQW